MFMLFLGICGLIFDILNTPTKNTFKHLKLCSRPVHSIIGGQVISSPKALRQ